MLLVRGLLCIAVAAWAVTPTIGHTPHIPDVISAHAEMDVDHGHSHSEVEDLWWALHGHHHDKLDHDHSLGVLFRPAEAGVFLIKRISWYPPMTSVVSTDPEPLERPPRV